nr:PEPxxWA-CTERM sorting domain-containing protein [Thermaurantiacus tibetensis]
MPPLSGVGTNVPYEVTEFTVTADGLYPFVNLGINPVNWDNYLHLYRDSFNPLAQFTNLLAGNDDLGFIGRSGFDFGLLAGVTYFAVTSGFSNDDFRQWEMTIRGPGDILLAGGGVIPEPGIWAMMIAGFGLVGAGLRRRRVVVAA